MRLPAVLAAAAAALAVAAASGCSGHITDPAGSSDGGGTGGGADAEPPPQPGLRAQYFDGYHDLAVDTVEATLDHDWGDQPPMDRIGADRFSARWTGTLTAPTSGTYTIATEADDGVRVWVDGTLLIDDWHGHYVERHEGTIDLQAGVPVDLRVDYFEIDLTASIRLLWSSDAVPEQVIPEDALESGTGQPVPPTPPYVNPVVGFDCPDPGVLATTGDDGLPLYAMTCTGGSFPIRRSRDLVLWQDSGAAVLPDGKPPWAANGYRNWAAEIHKVGDHYVAYYVTVNGANVLSIGASSASDPFGPYAPQAGPLLEDPQGVIDPTYFEDDDGTRWLIYKTDGNAQGATTFIYARQLAADGLSFAPGSGPVELLHNDPSTWEAGVVEAPWLVKRDGTYYLFYSGNVYDGAYREGVARSASLLGPYEKHGAPILGDNERWVAPGHGSVVPVNGTDYFVYHAWSNLGGGAKDTSLGRQVLVDRIDWASGWPQIGDGSPGRSEELWPGTTDPTK